MSEPLWAVPVAAVLSVDTPARAKAAWLDQHPSTGGSHVINDPRAESSSEITQIWVL